MHSLPTQRTLAELKRLGFTSQVVERFNRFANVRQDLFGCIDVLAVSADPPTLLGIQACARGDHAKRRAKALAEPRLRTWLQAGGRFEVWSWAKMGPRGKRKTWQVWKEQLTADDIAAADIAAPAVPDLLPVENSAVFLSEAVAAHEM